MDTDWLVELSRLIWMRFVHVYKKILDPCVSYVTYPGMQKENLNTFVWDQSELNSYFWTLPTAVQKIRKKMKKEDSWPNKITIHKILHQLTDLSHPPYK